MLFQITTFPAVFGRKRNATPNSRKRLAPLSAAAPISRCANRIISSMETGNLRIGIDLAAASSAMPNFPFLKNETAIIFLFFGRNTAHRCRPMRRVPKGARSLRRLLRSKRKFLCGHAKLVQILFHRSLPTMHRGNSRSCANFNSQKTFNFPLTWGNLC